MADDGHENGTSNGADVPEIELIIKVNPIIRSLKKYIQIINFSILYLINNYLYMQQ